MEVESNEGFDDDTSKNNINDLPDEVLEYIFSLVSPYKDVKECMLVCKRWLSNVKNVIRVMTLKLTHAITTMDVAWQAITPVEMEPTITKRFSHSACYHDNSMYVFGGCTSTSTTFNDLWRLDLNKRKWVRPLATGTYPNPKACSSMVQSNNALIVFGGWTLPSPYPVYQACRLFSELHIYSITENRWTCINTAFSPPGMAGHSATVHGDTMVVFGGLKSENNGQYASSNDVWCFNLRTQEWTKPATSTTKPNARYGQSQIWLKKDAILIIGGCGGPNMIYNDVWLLSLKGSVWEWREVEVQNREWAATYMWCHRACRVGNQVVMMSRDPRPLKKKPNNGAKSKPRPRTSSVWFPPRYEEPVPNVPRRISSAVSVDRDLNVNGQRGSFSRPTRSPRQDPAHRPESDLKPGPSGLNKRTRSALSQEDQLMDCEPGPSGERSHSVQRTDCQPGPSNHSRASQPIDCQPGPSGVGKQASPSKNESQDNSSPSSSNTHNWDRLRPINRSSSAENRVGNLQLAAFQDQEPSASTCPNRARERQLQALQRFEERMRYNNQPAAQEPAEDEAPVGKPQRTMVMCVLDITNLLEEECSVRWLPFGPEGSSTGPEETILYSLVPGRGEIIMFGGIHREATTLLTNSQMNTASNLSNSLHFISAPHGVI
ncbi:F-box only protein 42 [Thrips palmi]|uniref:F-box only protein 42 n=1 Tax=Thrips palmi TaxID=161013 RepID=A0A6P8YCR6_THRPL|nr:F-box only protein 42 [Thrips palmi]